MLSRRKLSLIVNGPSGVEKQLTTTMKPCSVYLLKSVINARRFKIDRLPCQFGSAASRWLSVWSGLPGLLCITTKPHLKTYGYLQCLPLKDKLSFNHHTRGDRGQPRRASVTGLSWVPSVQSFEQRTGGSVFNNGGVDLWQQWASSISCPSRVTPGSASWRERLALRLLTSL